ncbi:MAG: PPC domain-containing protein, partial [Candidatus Promineifilaceae bacterium]
ASNSWVPLDVRYDLGTDITIDPSRPARGWPRGGFAGDYLWAIGGHRDTAGGDNVLNLVERLFLPSRHDFGPIIAYDDPSGEPDDTLDEARGLPLNLTVSGSFYGPEDYIDVYFFDVPSPRQLTISLTNIPVGSDYNFRLYNSNKLWRATSDNIGHNDEVLPFELAAGRFYIFVERVFPPVGSDPQTQPYHIWVAG